MHIDKDLVAASATPLVLGILAEGESYGYAILKRVNELSGGKMTWTDGMLYPLLHRLERLGQVEAHWRIAENGRRRKHYAITGDGRAALADRRRQWAVVSAAMDRLSLDALPAQRWALILGVPTGSAPRSVPRWSARLGAPARVATPATRRRSAHGPAPARIAAGWVERRPVGLGAPA